MGNAATPKNTNAVRLNDSTSVAPVVSSRGLLTAVYVIAWATAAVVA